MANLVAIPLSPFAVDQDTGAIYGPPVGAVLTPGTPFPLSQMVPINTTKPPYIPPESTPGAPVVVQAAPPPTPSSRPPTAAPSASSSSKLFGLPRYVWYIGAAAAVAWLLTE